MIRKVQMSKKKSESDLKQKLSLKNRFDPTNLAMSSVKGGVSCDGDTESVSTISIGGESTASQLSQRKFAALATEKCGPGKAREMREAVRSSLSTLNPLRGPPICQPLDYENFLVRNRTALENDPQRDMLLFPRDDLTENVVPREERTEISSVSAQSLSEANWLLAKESLRSYSAPYRYLSFNYAKYGGDFSRLISAADELPELTYEIDLLEDECGSDQVDGAEAEVIKEGFLLQASESSSAVSLHKTFKKRHCIFRRIGCSLLELETSKDRGSPGLSKILVEGVLKGTRKGRNTIEIFTSSSRQGHVVFTCETDAELDEWYSTLNGHLSDKGGGGDTSKEDAMSTCSGAGDTESISSEESQSHWKGRAAQRALIPPKTPRRDIFGLYPDLEPASNATQSSLLIRDPGSPRGSSDQSVPFLVEFRGLTLKVPLQGAMGSVYSQIEPFFIRLYLLDTKTGRRISEEFHLDPNPTELKEGLPKTEKTAGTSAPELRGIKPEWVIEQNRKALFSVARPHSEVYLVARLERLLQSEGVDAYFKGDPKISAKLQKGIPTVLEKLGRFRSAFAWTARPVFQELLGNTKESLPLYRCEAGKATDTEIIKFISDMNRPEKAGKLQVFPGAKLSLHLDLSVRLDEILSRITPSLLPVRPFPPSPAGPPVIEIQSFPNATDIETKPHGQFMNHLYVYPNSLRYDGQKSFSKARNIVCWIQLRDSDNFGASKPLQVIYSRQDSRHPSPFVASVSCSVSHHDLTPNFASEEIKLVLPINLTPKHHLLFSFGHVAVAAALSNKPSDAYTPVESPCGYAWLPLLKDENKLNMDSEECEFLLPIAVDLPENYLKTKPLGLGKGFSGPEIKWVEGGRPLFKIKLKIVSSIFSTDGKLQGFFQACQKLSKNGTLADAGDAEKTKDAANKPNVAWGEDVHIAVKALLSIEPNKLIPFLPAVLNQLLTLLPLAAQGSEEVALSCLRTLVGIVDMAIQSGQTAALRHYVRAQFRADENGIHESLCKLLPLLLRPAHADSGTTGSLLRQAWFFLEIATKSMGQRLLAEEKHKLSRSDRYPPELLFRIESMVQTFVSMLVARHKEYPVETRAGNEALAHFLRACLSLTDRGLVFGLIYFYVEKVDKTESKGIRELKLDFLFILSQHEHWIPLSLPVICGPNGMVKKSNSNTFGGGTTGNTNNPNVEGKKTLQTSNSGGSGFFSRLIAHFVSTPAQIAAEEKSDLDTLEELKLTQRYFENHFLVGLVLQEVIASLKESKEIRKRGLAILRNLLAKHAADSRYSTKGAQSRLATLYFPLLLLVMEILPEVEDARLSTPTAPSRSPIRDEGGRRAGTLPAQLSAGPDQNLPSPGRNSLIVTSDKGHSRSGSSQSGGMIHQRTDSEVTVTSGNINLNLSQNLAFIQLTEKLDQQEARDLVLCVLYLLKNAPEEWLALNWKQMGAGKLLEFLKILELSLELFKYQGRRFTLKKTSNKLRVSRRTITFSPLSTVPIHPSVSSNVVKDGGGGDTASLSLPFSVLQEEHLAQEIGLIVLDTLTVFCRVNRDRFESKLAENKEIFLKCLFLYQELLSENSSEDLRLQVLPQLGAFLRSFSSTFFMGALQPMNEMGRCLLEQLSSRLLSVQKSAAALLQILLRSSYEFAGRGSGLGRFGSQLGVALAHLLGEARQLPDNPSFHRGLTLLENLASKEKRANQFDNLVQELVRQLRGVLSATGALKEAEKDPYRMAELHLRLADSYRGSFQLRQAWLESLAKLHEKGGHFSEAGLCHLHVAAMMAKQLSSRALAVCDWDLFNTISENIPKEENVDGANIDSENAALCLETYTERVEDAMQMMYRSERYEAMGPVSRLILPIYEKKRNYKALADSYENLQRAYSRAVALKNSGKRILASYFRVVFYGKFHFGEDSGREWVYKEPGLVSLSEFADKIKSLCIVTLGHDRIKFLSENDEIESKHSNDETTAFVQITHVEPWSEEEDDYWRHANVKKFKFETRDKGVRMDDVTKQGKRRIFLTAARTFPYLLSRLLVTSRREESLNPLQVAIEELRNKSSQLRRTLTHHGQDAKRIQLQLQGAVQTTVNAGPLAYAQAFTEENQRKKYGEEGIDRLKFAFRELVLVCTDALEANAELISEDQAEYQKMLEEGFGRLVQNLTLLFGNEFVPVNEPESDETNQNNQPHHVQENIPGNRGSQHVFDTIGGVSTEPSH